MDIRLWWDGLLFACRQDDKKQKTMKKQIIIIIALMLASVAKSQTATPMAQYASNQLIYNPAFAGAHDLFSANLSLRRLWTGIPNSPTLIGFNMHAPFIDQRNALGFIFQRETYGPQFINLVNLTYAYKIPLNNTSFLSFGVQTGLLNTVTDWSMVTFVKDDNDPGYGGNERWVTNRFDMSLGAYLQTPDFYIGLSVRHLTTPRFDEVTRMDTLVDTREIVELRYRSRIRRQFFFMAGYNFQLDQQWDIRPRMMIRYKYAMPLTVSAGVDFVYLNRFSFGTSFMTGQSAVTLVATAEVVDGLRIGYAFDMNFGVIRPFQRGSHEIFISYFMPVWNRATHPYNRNPFR